MPKPRKRRDKAYRPRAVKDTTYLLTEREPPSRSDANTLKIVYSADVSMHVAHVARAHRRGR